MGWCQTVGHMLVAKGCSVRAVCHRCKYDEPADLEAIAAKRGRDFSLINVRSPCRTPGCEGFVVFIGAGGHGAWMHPLYDEAHANLWSFGVPLELTRAAQRRGRTKR